MRKYHKKSYKEKLQKRAEELAKEYTKLRDGKGCQVFKHYPYIFVQHTDVDQVDHCFSRSIKELFLDVANLTVLCSGCNAAKGSNHISASKKDAITVAVHEIVKKREGIDTYNRLLEIASRKCAFKDWGNVLWLETQIKILEEMIEEIKTGNDHEKNQENRNRSLRR